jgi:predicted SprT family Zn-dependent metalloprotease
MTIELKPTEEQSQALQKIYDYLNVHLFDGELTDAMYILSRNKNVTGGYFASDAWENDDGRKIHEVGINANVVAAGDLIEVLKIMAHEQAHHWQHDHGTPSRKGYHNEEWGLKMEEIGIEPLCYDNDPEGIRKLSGQKMGNGDIMSGGKFEAAIVNMPDELIFEWSAIGQVLVDNDGEVQKMPSKPNQKPSEDEDKPKKQKAGARTKYTCLICGTNVWGKPDLNITCTDCNRPFTEQV